jgi:hypothetical protein
MTNRPLSAALQKRIADNIIDVYERGDCVAMPMFVNQPASSPGTNYLLDRPWTSVDWACCWVCPIQVGRNFASITVDFAARIFREVTGGGLANPSMELELRADGFSQRLTITESTARYRPYSITLNLPSGRPAREIQVSLWLRDPAPGYQTGAGTYALGALQVISRNALRTASGKYVDTTGNEPNPGSRDLFATSEDAAAPDERTPVYDHIRIDNAIKLGTDMGVYPTIIAPLISGWLRPLSYAQLKGIAIRTTYNGQGLYTPSELRANIPEVSEVAQKHLRLQDEIYLRPGVLAIGTGGKIGGNATAGWPGRYRQSWDFVKGDDTATLIASAIAPCFAPEHWTLRALFIGTHSVADSGSTEGDTITEIVERAATATWELTFDVRQSLTTVATDSLRFSATHYPVDTRLTSRFLYQQYWAQRIDFTEDNYFTYREGLLYREDFDFVQEVSVPLSGAGVDWAQPGGDVDFDLPIDFRVQLERVASVTPTYRQGTAVERVPANLRLVLVGLSIQRERFFL